MKFHKIHDAWDIVFSIIISLFLAVSDVCYTLLLLFIRIWVAYFFLNEINHLWRPRSNRFILKNSIISTCFQLYGFDSFIKIVNTIFIVNVIENPLGSYILAEFFFSSLFFISFLFFVKVNATQSERQTKTERKRERDGQCSLLRKIKKKNSILAITDFKLLTCYLVYWRSFSIYIYSALLQLVFIWNVFIRNNNIKWHFGALVSALISWNFILMNNF